MESGIIQEWIVVISFFAAVAVCIFGEALWLSRKGWSGFGKGVGFSALTNIISFAVGFFVLFVVLLATLMLSFDSKMDKFPGGDTGIIMMFIVTVLITPILLILTKRIFLRLLKIQTGKTAWFYSIIASLISFPLLIGEPILLIYLLFMR